MYSIGVDYGTQSGRAVLVDLTTGEELAVSVKSYPHGVMDEYLPNHLSAGKRLPPDFALQHPQDYLDVLSHTIPDVLAKSGISADSVVGLGIDFTACTILPIDKNGKPLCFLDEYKENPHSYVKLWKHHAAQDEANRLNQIAEERKEPFLQRYGGKISSEWLVPKVWQMLNESPELYAAADRFMEAADWVILQLTGTEARNSCTAGYKALWSKKDGYPNKAFFKALDPRLENLVDDKLSRDIYPIGHKAGEITEAASRLCGLKVGTAVAVANVDAHVSLPALGITEPGKMLMIMGTSTCHIMLGDEERMVPGMCGVVQDGVVPGYPGYEAGQSCVGDHFEWFVENAVPEAYTKAAKEAGMDIHSYLSNLASKLRVGESGLLALDWWNGNRSVLVDGDLTGLLLGANLLTKPEEIYRALIEATAFGTRMIIEAFNENGVPVKELYACGGIAEKNAMMMQIYADVSNCSIKISGSAQAPALGSAMWGAVAAGKEKGGFDTIEEAVPVMAKLKDDVYHPIPENVKVYELLFREYKELHDYFGRGQNKVMKKLKEIRQNLI